MTKDTGAVGSVCAGLSLSTVGVSVEGLQGPTLCSSVDEDMLSSHEGGRHVGCDWAMLGGRNWCELADRLSQAPEVLAGHGACADDGGHKVIWNSCGAAEHHFC